MSDNKPSPMSIDQVGTPESSNSDVVMKDQTERKPISNQAQDAMLYGPQPVARKLEAEFDKEADPPKKRYQQERGLWKEM